MSQVITTPLGDNTFRVIWQTKTVYVMTSGAAAPFPIKILHGFRKFNVDYVVSPELDHRTVLAVHGFMHNARFFTPLGLAMLSDLSYKTSHFYAISLPGHGDMTPMTPNNTHGMSGVPDNFLYGDMTLEVYAEALIEVAKQLGRIDTIIGHSQGGIVVQLAEALLQAAQASFCTIAQTSRIALMASALPSNLPWAGSDTGGFYAILQQVATLSSAPNMGTYYSMTDSAWSALFYSVPNMTVQGAPAAALVPQLRTNAPWVASSKALGLPVVPQPPPPPPPPMLQLRPDIPANLLQPFDLRNIAFEEDALIAPSEAMALSNHLKQGAPLILLPSVPGDPAFHSTPYTSPARLIPYLAGGIAL